MTKSSLQLQARKIEEYRNLKKTYKKILAGIILEVQPHVYPGGTDSELLCKSMVIQKNDLVLDLCTGNGIVAIAAAQKGALHVTGTDLNPRAIKNANRNKALNALSNVTFIEMNLFPSDNQIYDVITINPPYTNNIAHDKIAICFWDKDNHVVKMFFKKLGNYLKKDGTAYITWSSFADQKLLPALAHKYNLILELIDSCEGNSGFIYYVYRLNLN
jgi:HemK-related putative methylase